MSKKMPINDFRAMRTVLEASDFAHAPDPSERPAKDLVAQATWEHIQTLPETVAVFTSNDHGTELSLMTDLWGCWVETLQTGSVPASKRAVHRACLIATDEFQAATFNALHGFYRVVADSLRSTVEQMTIATNLELQGNDSESRAWDRGGTQCFLERLATACKSDFRQRD